MRWERRLAGTGRTSLVLGGTEGLVALSEQAARAAEHGTQLFLITDQNVQVAWGEAVGACLRPALRPTDILVLAPGEGSKNAVTLTTCWDWLAERGCRRSDTVVALGGGVIGDLAGLAAATYQRGVGLWQIPTTLLAQVDSSVGGKTAIDLAAGKNLVGAFYQPDLVVIDPLTLGTLADDEYCNGLGEVAKYGLLDPGLFALLEAEQQAIAARDPVTLAALVRRCVEYKADVVEEDERDTGRRAVLNLGHTVAHALELTAGYGSLSHGRAVGLGLLPALAVSERLLGLDPDVRPRLRRILTAWNLPVSYSLPPLDVLLAAVGRDKKVTSAGRGFVGLRALGEPVWGLPVTTEVLSAALEVIRA